MHGEATKRRPGMLVVAICVAALASGANAQADGGKHRGHDKKHYRQELSRDHDRHRQRDDSNRDHQHGDHWDDRNDRRHDRDEDRSWRPPYPHYFGHNDHSDWNRSGWDRSEWRRDWHFYRGRFWAPPHYRGRHCDDRRHYHGIHYHVSSRDYYDYYYPRYRQHGSRPSGANASVIITLPLF